MIEDNFSSILLFVTPAGRHPHKLVNGLLVGSPPAVPLTGQWSSAQVMPVWRAPLHDSIWRTHVRAGDKRRRHGQAKRLVATHWPPVSCRRAPLFALSRPPAAFARLASSVGAILCLCDLTNDGQHNCAPLNRKFTCQPAKTIYLPGQPSGWSSEQADGQPPLGDPECFPLVQLYLGREGFQFRVGFKQAHVCNRNRANSLALIGSSRPYALPAYWAQHITAAAFAATSSLFSVAVPVGLVDG